ncbi:hypothetical protein OROMI_033238 [Orobanche minor]
MVMDPTKSPFWVIGKYAKPICFKNVNMNNLNCEYRFNKKARMTGLLFQEFSHWFEKRMNGRKVLLLVDNCPAHPKVVEGLRNVELFFLPPNTTTKIQPCDAGIIRAFKLHYRRHFYSSILQSLEIRSEELDVPEAEADKLEEDIERLTNVISKLHYRNVMDIEHLLNCPNDNDVVMELPTDDEIIESVLNDENDPEPDDSSVTPNVSSKEAYQAVITLRNYFSTTRVEYS